MADKQGVPMLGSCPEPFCGLKLNFSDLLSKLHWTGTHKIKSGRLLDDSSQCKMSGEHTHLQLPRKRPQKPFCQEYFLRLGH